MYGTVPIEDLLPPLLNVLSCFEDFNLKTKNMNLMQLKISAFALYLTIAWRIYMQSRIILSLMNYDD
jgi:hypothetical protein